MGAIAKKNTKEGAASRSLHRSVALSLTLILSWFALAADSVMASDLRCNMNSSGQVTIADCLRQAFNQTDVELNERYQAILTAFSTAGTKDANFVSARQRLIESQRSWIKFRDQDCKGLSTLVPDDPAIDSRNTACLIDRTQRRLLEFDAWESLLPGGRAAALIAPDADVGGAVEYARPDDAIAGQPLSHWIERYWQWQLSFPPGSKPSDDRTGSLCAVRQNERVFFLTGSETMAPVTRRCTVRRGKFIAAPIINTIAKAVPGKAANCESFQRALRQMNDSGTDMAFSVNGLNAPSDAIQKAGTECFMLDDAADSGAQLAAGAGHWVVLNPPAPGRYLVKFSGKFAIDGFTQSVLYVLTVE